jgi:hypothetical protein
MRATRRQFTATAASLLASAALGCATGPDKTLLNGKTASEKSLLDRLPFRGKKKDDAPEPYPNPVKIAATWTPDTLVQMGRTPTRGFGGRVFFYDEKSRPVPVEGTLTVHGFDDDDAEAQKNVKRFEFTPEQFTRHYSQSDLGASYSVWIPWDAVGNDQKRISLVASFKTAEGQLIQGIPATLMLPGTTPVTPEQDEFAKLSPQYRKYRDALADSGSTPSGLTTTTIRRRHSQTPSPSDVIQPGIKIPQAQDSGTMIANQNSTPSFDLEMTKKSMRSLVRPASAQIPIQR